MNIKMLVSLAANVVSPIVELLIVIVVIGILAAIVIVAYNGITNRANDTNNKTDAVSIQKVAEAINADKGYYPGGTGDATTVWYSNAHHIVWSVNDDETTQQCDRYIPRVRRHRPFNLQHRKGAADGSPHSYTVKVCGGTTGLTVFYPKREDSTIQKINIGTGWLNVKILARCLCI